MTRFLQIAFCFKCSNEKEQRRNIRVSRSRLSMVEFTNVDDFDETVFREIFAANCWSSNVPVGRSSAEK